LKDVHAVIYAAHANLTTGDGEREIYVYQLWDCFRGSYRAVSLRRNGANEGVGAEERGQNPCAVFHVDE
jgi:hypothetical protein